MLLGAPLDLALDASRARDGAMNVAIHRGEWKSAHAEGALALAPGSTVPEGSLRLAIANLADFAPLAGRKLEGRVNATLDSNAQRAKLGMTAERVGMPGTAAIARAVEAEIEGVEARPILRVSESDARVTRRLTLLAGRSL